MIENESPFSLPVPKHHWYQRLLSRPVKTFLVVIGLWSFLCLLGYDMLINSIPASRKNIVGYYLVDIDHKDSSEADIYAIDDPSTVKYISHWIEQSIDHTKDKALALCLLDQWQDGLLGYDRDGHLVSMDCMYGHNQISSSDYATLKELFWRCGHRVDTVPDRKPPNQSKCEEGRILVEPRVK